MDHKGFVVLERRPWVERGFGRLSHRNGLLRARAYRFAITIIRFACVACLKVADALNNPV